MNYEVNNFKKCEFDKVNLIIYKLSQIEEIATPLLKIQVQGTTVPNIKARECMVFSTKELQAKKYVSR